MNNTSLVGNETNPVKTCSSSNAPHVAILVKVVLYLITMAISLAGNLLVICVVYRNRRLRTPTNYLITNMAISDFLMTIVSMTPTAASFLTYDFSWYDGWLGIASCKLLTFVQGTTMASSIFTLTAIAFERFNAIVFPLRTTMRSRSTIWLISAVWYTAGLVTSPMLFVMTVQTYSNKPYCVEKWKAPLDPEHSPAIYTVVSFVLLYALPLSVITFMYACVVYTVWLRRIPGNINRSIRKLQRKVRKNVVKMLITVVVVFAIFWLPLHLIMILLHVADTFSECGVPDKLYLVSYILSHATGAVNFLIYVAFSEDYKKGFKSLCRCFIGGVKTPMRPGQPSARTEQTTENRRSTSRKVQDIELKKLTSNTDLDERSTPRTRKNVQFDMEYSSSV
ncbi:hypothetical protein QZH41_006060 [Actinostola sp. cb2023]|nr:hypothetical protein QZH41_006060 [Actinostola sp. cb2023]